MIRTVIINRAVPGSGKTTITNCIVNQLKEKTQVLLFIRQMNTLW